MSAECAVATGQPAVGAMEDFIQIQHSISLIQMMPAVSAEEMGVDAVDATELMTATRRQISAECAEDSILVLTA